MGKGAIILGVVFIIFGIFLIFITNLNLVGVIYGIVAIAIGIALIVMYKEEDKIEERKDLVKSQTLKPKK